MLAGPFGIAQQLVIEVWLDVFAAVGEAWQAEAPKVDACEKIRAKGSVSAQVAICSADELEVAALVLVCAKRAIGLFFDRLEEHRLGFHRQFADFVKEDDAAVGLLEESGVVGAGAGVGSFPVSEKG